VTTLIMRRRSSRILFCLYISRHFFSVCSHCGKTT